MSIRSVLLAATVLAIPAAAMAQAPNQPINGLYIAGGAGYNWTQNVDIKNSNANLHGSGGLAAVASAGWGFGNGFRAEVEGNYRGNHYSLHNAGGVNGGGNADNYGLMLNGFYDFTWLNLGVPVVPYVGAGVGYQWTQLSSVHLAGYPGSQRTEGGFSAQGILGAAYALPVPGLSLTAEYRFMATVENETFHYPAGSIKIGDQYNHAGLIGVRYAFNAAPPPPPAMPAPVAAPAPAPARTYLVFFDWDKADLSARAHQIIAEAAQNSTRVQVTRIEVDGYADRTGTAQYNVVLSRKRADNVAAELVKDGVPKNIIAIQAFGDTHLLVPTGPGVREPQNRRVEIILK
jgi:outer membrane protein OmpA-like peptidoglycan-associated protein